MPKLPHQPATQRRTLALLPMALLPMALAICWFVGTAWAADPAQPPATESAATLRAPESYGILVLAPAVIAIVCAIVTRQVVPSLLAGIVTAALLLTPCLPPAESFGDSNRLVRVVRLTVEVYVIDAIIDPGHVKVILFTLIIGAMVGVVDVNGGTRALVDVIAGRAPTARRGQLTAWLAGLLVFFDDYANTMIVGPTMQPVCDRLRISRAKLAYIVDSTAAPVASIALVGTWVGAEIGYIQDGIDKVRAAADVPAFLEGMTGWQAFVGSLPYRFYPILAIVLVFIVAMTGRDIGPMRRSEAKARGSIDTAGTDAVGTNAAGPRSGSSWWLAAVPIMVLVVGTFGVLLWPGTVGRPEGQPLDFKAIFENADPYVSILYGAVLGLVVAIGITVLSRRGSLKIAIDGAMSGLTRMIPAVIVLVLAWALSDSSQRLHVGEVVSRWLDQSGFSLTWLPLAVFLCSAGVSFATGTSWGTMGILCPMVVTVAAGLASGLSAETACPLFYASVGSVLAGAIFGDHCSPISDTTVLSSIASGCSLEEHVWTQMPYALIAAAVGMIVGDTLCNKFDQSPLLGLAIGIVALYVIVCVLGKPAHTVEV